MVLFSKELINNYINGLDIDNYNIDELENNKDFMLSVIKYSNDFNFYNLCSVNVKSNYELVKYLVLNYKSNINFIIKVCEYYLNNKQEDVYYIELLLIMISILPKDNDYYIKYSLLLESIYSRVRVENIMLKEYDKSEDFNTKLGLGFFLIYDDYNSSELVIKYFAHKLILSIIEDINLEEYIHNNYSTKEDLIKYGINNFLIKLISKYDITLSSYVSVHIDLLEDLYNIVLKLLDKWDIYSNKEESIMYDDIINKVINYMNDSGSVIPSNSMLYYVGKKLGIENKLKYYEGLDDDLFNYLMEELNIEFIDNLDFITYNIKNDDYEHEVYLCVYNMMKPLINEKSNILYGNFNRK